MGLHLNIVFLLLVALSVVKTSYSGINLDKFYLVSDSENVLNNIIVQPKQLSSEYFEEKHRIKRSINDSESDLQNDLEKIVFAPNAVTLEIEDWILLLEENTRFSFGNKFSETWISDSKDNEKSPKGEQTSGCQFYTGLIFNDPKSKAAVTICDFNFYYGFFTTDGKSYFIEPTAYPVNGHIVYKPKLPNIEEFSEQGEVKDDLNANVSILESGPDSSLPRPGSKTSQGNSRSGTGNWQGKDKRKVSLTGEGKRKVLKRKRCTHCEKTGVFNLTGDTILDDGNFNFTEEVERTTQKENKSLVENNSYDDYDYYEPRVGQRWHRNDDEEALGYFSDIAWQTRPYPVNPVKEKWLEIALAVDYTIIEFHGKERIRQYIMALLNIVSAIYKDPSLDANLNLVLARLIFYDDKKDSMIEEGNAKKSLENVNRWNYRLIGKLSPDESPHDVAVWLTREFLGGPSGYAPVAGACDRARSTALNKDEGLASAFIIAHEMAHILGLTHDGDLKAGNRCDDEVIKGTIMAPTVTANFHRFSWSSCSKEEFHRNLNKWSCLLNAPGKNHTILETGTTHKFTMDEQCRMEYGDGYSLCQKFEHIEPCTHLWCGHKNSSLYCITKKGPPVEGTQCGFEKWCVDGYCQNVDVRLSGGEAGVPREGNWGNWTEWSPCSRPCGYGIRIRKRRCDNPPPAWGGADCVGPSEEKRVCRQSRSCWQLPTWDPRADRCAALPSQGGYQDWLPYDTDEEDLICRVSCVLWESGEVVRSGEYLPDGTPCSYETEHHICLEGKCHEYGCDGIANSSAREDRCGVCNGNGDTCFDNHIVFNKTLKKGQHQNLTRLLVLPRYTRDVNVRVNLHSSSDPNQVVSYAMFHLALKDRSKKVYRMLIRDPNDMLEMSQQKTDQTSPVWADYQDGPAAVLGGSALRVGRPPGALTLRAKGPLHTDITLLISTPPNDIGSVNATLMANYTLSGAEQGRYKWARAGAQGCGACAASRATAECVDTKRGNRTVHASMCARSERPRHSERCNMTCSFHWVPGPWEYCTATCGTKGISHRQVYCVPLTIKNDTKKIWRYMVGADKCTDDIPIRQKPCNRFLCPSYWVEGPWSKCSSSCAPGVSSRSLTCPGGEGACGPPVGAPYRACRGPCAGAPPCRRDRSPYCALPALLRYCLIPTFQRFCCQSCKVWLLENKIN